MVVVHSRGRDIFVYLELARKKGKGWGLGGASEPASESHFLDEPWATVSVSGVVTKQHASGINKMT